MGALDLALPFLTKAAAPELLHEAGKKPDKTLGDAPGNTAWITLAHDPQCGIPNFSLPLLHKLNASIQALRRRQENMASGGDELACGDHVQESRNATPLHYAVMRSDHADYFNAGGDLKYFRRCITEGNRQGLYQYSMLCLDVLMGWAACANGSTSTIALVQGRALGGGFEAALAADYLIAEEHSTFGFPEIMFGLFPCTGAMSLLARRVGPAIAERMMTDGKVYTAGELLAMGIVDAVCARADGERETARFIASHARHRRARQAVGRCRKRQAPLDYRELKLVLEDWVDLAMSLDNQSLKVMEMLILMQDGASRCAARPQ